MADITSLLQTTAAQLADLIAELRADLEAASFKDFEFDEEHRQMFLEDAEAFAPLIPDMIHAEQNTDGSIAFDPNSDYISMKNIKETSSIKMKTAKQTDRLNEMEKFLPISVQDFVRMITGNFVYVDKTRYIYEMVRIPQAYYFLARPRRFGKSLLVSTLRTLFEGRRDLFKGLWIDTSDWQWKPHPVVVVDFSQIKATNASLFEESLSSALDQIADQHALILKQNLLANKFVELTMELHKKYQEEVVVLVDEYDKPIITHLGQGEAGLQTAKEIRTVLKEFFGVLKGADVAGRLRMVFITGVSKFSKVSIFSELNNLQDLSMQAPYAGLLGYTREELEKCFSAWIAEFARDRQTTPDEILQLLRDWYNGHRFTKVDLQVYNPFSIINALAEREFKNYWFETGTPSFLVNLIQEKDYPIPNLENLHVQDATFATYELENLQLEALLFQTGYLTINDYDGMLYRLGYPNQEVKTAFLNQLQHARTRHYRLADGGFEQLKRVDFTDENTT